MPTLYVRARSLPDGSRRFDVKYRRGGRYTHLEHGGTFKTRREANLRREKIGEWLALGLNPKIELRRVVTPARPLSDVHTAYIASRRNIEDGTRQGLVARQKRIDADLGTLAVDELTVEDVIEWVGELDAEYAPGTVGLFVRQLRKVLDFAGVPNVARDRRVELPKNTPSEVNPPDAPEVVSMLGTLPDRLVLPVLTMEQLGSRVSETLSLERRDIEEDRVRFRREITKGKRKGRYVECDPLLAEALSAVVPFTFSRDAVGRGMRDVGEIHPHLLRHRRATLWHQQGVWEVELARRLGHAKPSMSLDRYANVKPLKEIPAQALASFLR